jgi:cobalt/nickel transport system ATP-binding protein
VLKGLTLDFSRHAVTGLVGANGCGKSTLFMNLSGFAPAARGGAVAGKTAGLQQARLLALRQQVATVFQDPDQQIFIPISTAISL